MLNKIKNWMDKPYTRGDVVKWSAISMGVLVLEYAALLYGPYVSGKIKEFKEKKQEEPEEDIY